MAAALLVATLLLGKTRPSSLPTHVIDDDDDQHFRVVHYRYGIVFDAGSSGSRIHVYTYRTGAAPPLEQFDLVHDDLVKITPGLSSFKDKPADAGASLQPLIDHARKKIPDNLHYRTPVFLMATAGLRVVGEKVKDEILDSVRATLARSGFRFRDEWVGVLDGKEEGIYGWMTVNYLLNALYPKTNDPVGVIDLGGGSVQIAFPTKRKRVAPLGYQQQHDFQGREHNVYVTSHLGYGLDAARDTLYELLIERSKLTQEEGAATTGQPIPHPCLPKDSTLEAQGHEFVGEGSYARCQELVTGLFDTSSCLYPSCSFNGAYQPPLPAKMYGFSYLYDRTAAIGLLDGHPNEFGEQRVRIRELEHATEGLCVLGKNQLAERFRKAHDHKKAHLFCGDTVYLAVLLRALGFEEDYSLTMTNKIDGTELVWTLGAIFSKVRELADEKEWYEKLLEPQNLALIGVALLALYWFFCCARPVNKHSYRHVLRPDTSAEDE